MLWLAVVRPQMRQENRRIYGGAPQLPCWPCCRRRQQRTNYVVRRKIKEQRACVFASTQWILQFFINRNVLWIFIALSFALANGICCRWLFCDALFFVQDICQRGAHQERRYTRPWLAMGVLRHIKPSFVGRKGRDSCRQGYQRDESLTREQALALRQAEAPRAFHIATLDL
jgi:hypothetical protein